MSNENVPAVRFGEHSSGIWEDRTIGSLAGQASGGGTPTKAKPEFWQGNIPWIQSSDLNESGVDLVRVRNYISQAAVRQSATIQIPKDSIAVVTRVGVGKVALMHEKYCTSQDFVSLSRVDGDSRFISIAVKSRMESLLHELQGSTIKGITKSELLQKSISIPKNLEEQRTIGEFFANLDKLIATHRAKHRALKQAKTSLLQRLFPRDGADEPEIRVADFSGKWKTRSMKKQAAYSKGKGYSKSDYSFEGTPLFLYGRIYTKYEIFVTTVDTFAHMQPGSVLSKGGEVLVPSSGETAEDIAVATVLMQPGVLLGGDLNVIRPSPDLDSVFLALTLSHGEPKAILEKRAQGKSVVHLNNSDIQSLNIRVPQTLQEQQTIGAIFVKLDTLITAQDAYIAKLTQIKTALLQKMFI